jgi:hypothetical protein
VDDELAPILSLERYREARRLMSRSAAVRLATYPEWPGNELADAVMDLWITAPSMSDEELCARVNITLAQWQFIQDRQWTWWETPEVDLNEHGQPRLSVVNDSGPDSPSAAN